METSVTVGNQGEKVRSDCSLSLEIRGSGGLEIQLESRVKALFGKDMEVQLRQLMDSWGLKHARLEVQDSGALPFVLAARLEAAVRKLRKQVSPQVPELLPQNLYETSADRCRFSRLYLPGNTPSMMLNAGIHQPEGIILDLEDSVAPGRKDEARMLVRNALCQVDFYGAERMVRINQLPMGLDDLPHVVPHHVHLILVPKCESASEVKEVDQKVLEILESHGQQRRIYLMPILETALGVEHAYQIACASERVVAMAIGLEDYTADLGVARSKEGQESLYARTRLVNAAKAAGIQPIDSVFSDVGDMEGLKEAVEQSRALGFEGMGCIHPRQVPVIQEAFCPSSQEVARAREVLQAFEHARDKGLGVIALGSKMIDAPVVTRARQTLEQARRFGKA